MKLRIKAMKQVEIFKTNVQEESKAALVIELLDECYPEFKANFDLEDEDRILRVESIAKQINGIEIERLLNRMGINCKIFAD
ncbi:MAG: hypothetical protein JWQ79_2404 [Mucilaginibacter sp.]|nr:hypothetical protein [Mucilaginibacter sp.]